MQRWKWTAALASAAAAIALAFLALPSSQAPVAPVPVDQAPAPLVASIASGETPLRLGVTFMPERSEMLVSAADLTADGVHDHELWLVVAEGDLQSLGVIVPGEHRRMPLAPEIGRHIADGAELLLTREPIGGKPDGQEAGPVVAQGRFTST